MPENAYARFFAGALLDFRAHYCANPAESRLTGFAMRPGSDEATVFLSRPFRDDDDCEIFPEVHAFLNFSADAFAGERNLRNQNHVRTARHTRVESDPAGVTSHDFENHDAVVTFSGSVKANERIGRAGHGGIKSKCEQRSFEIIVNRLRHAYYRNPVFKHLLRNAQRAVTADGYRANNLRASIPFLTPSSNSFG